ncbi:hypothetical protein [Adhaeretor mobilis]|uniref:Uncharacterized protein n=1 Tax=Adhaeretor mobilis TaxID=1930276 RepID=A0A517MVS7_9BACT|nr:hypothetical protein [Adhaeretor mobilis]QDS98980.1 hypothetical protein HG15A2_22690 [Adhaeretor mobilis]
MTEPLKLPDDRPIPRSDAAIGLSVLGLLAVTLCGSLVYRLAGPSTGPQTLPTPTVVLSPEVSEESLATSGEHSSVNPAGKVDVETLFQQDSEVAPANFLDSTQQ